MIYSRVAWAGSQVEFEFVDRTDFAFSKRLYTSVWEVPHISMDLMSSSRSLSEIAKANSLH